MGRPEAWWAVCGAAALLLFGFLPIGSAWHAVVRGLDVYLFLTGMMVMSELARREGVFDWIAAQALRAAEGSRTRLFVLIYTVGTVVTVFLSNDATAVVLTPAVLAVVQTAEAEPLPYLMSCAFIANAASFVLPISNPANLVVYSGGMPPLGRWLRTFGLPSFVSVLLTFLVLYFLVAKMLGGGLKKQKTVDALRSTGKTTLFGIGLLAAFLMAASALNMDLGAPACVAALLVLAAVWWRDHQTPNDVAREVSWSVLPLVAGLFVIVEAMNSAGALPAAVNSLRTLQTWSPLSAALTSGFGVALVSNLMNNLPSGLIGGAAVRAAGVSGPLRDSVLLGIDLGPNLSVTGSLATILWLIAIRRAGQQVGFLQFLRWGVCVMPPALAAAIGVALLTTDHG